MQNSFACCLGHWRPTAKERSLVLSTWLTSLGPVPTCATCAAASQTKVHQMPDLAWLTDLKQLSPTLSKQLLYLRDNRHQGPGYYVRLAPEVNNPQFQHEEAYSRLLAPDAGVRLLALFRFWNMIQYFYPHKYLLGEDWQRVLPEFIPRFVQATDAQAYRLAVLALVARIHDTHAAVSEHTPGLTRIWGTYLAPVLVSFVQQQPVVTKINRTTLGAQTPLQQGDVITKVDGVPVAALLQRQRLLLSASNEAALLAAIGLNLLRGNTPQGQIEVLRAGQPHTLTVPRYVRAVLNSAPQPPLTAPGDSSYRLLAGNVGYMHLGQLTPAQVPRAMQALKDTKGLVLDLRTYPDFEVFRLLPAYFVTQPTPFAKFTYPDLSYPGRFLETPVEQVLPAGGAAYGGKVAILVNEQTQSLAEYTAMALQANPRAVVVGSTTGGADGDVSPITFPGDLFTRISGLGVFYADGRQTQRVGILPTIKVKPTVAGLQAKRDEVLEKALNLLQVTP